MVKKFEMSAKDKKLIDNAIRRLDTIKAGKAKVAHAKAQATFKRRVKERRDARILANKVKHGTNDERQKMSLAGWKVLYARMEPDTWYLFSELLLLVPEFASGSVKAWVHQKGAKEGWLIRAGNPDWDGSHGHGGEMGSRYVYALAQKSTGMRAEWLSSI